VSGAVARLGGALGRIAWRGGGGPGSQRPVWLAIAIVLVLAGLFAPGFITVDHLLAVLRQVASLAIVTVGQVFVVITGGFDLSNGMVITLVTLLAATLPGNGAIGLAIICAASLALGAGVGVANGFLVTKMRVPPLISTLGTFGILKGVAYVYTNGAPKGFVPDSLKMLGVGHVGPFPIAAIFALLWVGAGAFILGRTVFGRRLFAAGSNPRAAHLSGVSLTRTIVAAYVVSGVSASVAGLVVAGYIGVGSLSAGNDYNLNSVAAAVIGGTALAGGTGSVAGGAAGALFLGLVVSLLRFFGLTYSWQLVLEGAILILAVVTQAKPGRRG
jgi:ribose transport system permease protein